MVYINSTTAKYYNEEILKEACSKYDIETSKAKLIRGNANLIFDCGDKVLRFTHSEIRNQEEIEVELDWLRFLNKQSLPVVKIIASQANNDLEIIGDTENYFSIVCFDKIHGAPVQNEEWNEKHFANLGTLTGKLHRIGQEYQEKPSLDYKHWNEIPEYYAYKHLPKDNRNLTALHQKAVDLICTFPISKQTYGLIHYDIHHGNYLLTPELQLFDFEMACKSWYINDVATVLYYAAGHSKSRTNLDFESFFLKHFWDAYQKEYDLSSTEKEKIPIFLLYRDLMLTGFLSNLWAGKELNKIEFALMERLQQSIEKRKEIFDS